MRFVDDWPLVVSTDYEMRRFSAFQSCLPGLALAMMMASSFGCQRSTPQSIASKRGSDSGSTNSGSSERAGADKPADDAAARRDNELIAKIEGAIKAGVNPEEVESVVGTPATINTFRDHRAGFERADIVADPDAKPSLPPRSSVRFVVYWVREVESHNPKIVGIFWQAVGGPQIFYAEVLPPS